MMTRAVSEPTRSPVTPFRPCEAITIRSQRLLVAAAMIAWWGEAWEIDCVVHATPSSRALLAMTARYF